MKYRELCQAFYLKRKTTGLKDIKNQYSIGEFFITSGIDQEKYEAYLPQSEDAYAKWYSGDTSPKAEIWEAVSKIDKKKYASNLEKAFNKDNIGTVAEKLRIRLRTGETLDLSRLAGCVTQTLISMSENSGISEKEPKEYYDGTESTSKFSDYIRYAQERYNLMKLIGGEEVFLDDYFVCNSIGEKINSLERKK